MKKIGVGLFLLFVVIGLNACKTNTPSGVAGAFLKALAELDFDAAKKYCTPEAQKGLEMMGSVMKMAGKSALDEAKKKNTKFTILKEEINGDNAVVTYKASSSEKEEQVKMKKIDGKWLVAMDKGDMGKKDSEPDNKTEPNKGGIDN